MKKLALSGVAILLLVFCLCGRSSGQWFLDFENGLAVPGYNDVRIPGDTGTLFSLSEELNLDSSYFFRLRLGYRWKGRHTLSVLAAPLRLNTAGRVNKEIVFFKETFPANVPLTGVYKFNSYRLTYRYDFLKREKWQAGIGFTAKIRDAFIKIEGEGRSSIKKNLGLVPLINFRVLWQFHKDWGLLLEGDAAAAPQGRAEDILLAIQYRLNDRLNLRAGYRILEGGADVKEVYTFALVHYLGAGLTYSF